MDSDVCVNSKIPPNILRKLTPLNKYSSTKRQGHSERKRALQEERIARLSQKSSEIKAKAEEIAMKNHVKIAQLKFTLEEKHQQVTANRQAHLDSKKQYAAKFSRNYSKFSVTGIYLDINNYRMVDARLKAVSDSERDPLNDTNLRAIQKLYNYAIIKKVSKSLEMFSAVFSTRDSVPTVEEIKTLRALFKELSNRLHLMLPKRLWYTVRHPENVLMLACIPQLYREEEMEPPRVSVDFIKLLQLCKVDLDGDEFWANYNDSKFFLFFLKEKSSCLAAQVYEKLSIVFQSSFECFESNEMCFWGAWRRYVDVLDITVWEAMNRHLITLIRLQNSIIAKQNYRKFVLHNSPTTYYNEVSYDDDEKLEKSNNEFEGSVSITLRKLVTFKALVIEKGDLLSDPILVASKSYVDRLDALYEEYLESGTENTASQSSNENEEVPDVDERVNIKFNSLSVDIDFNDSTIVDDIDEGSLQLIDANLESVLNRLTAKHADTKVRLPSSLPRSFSSSDLVKYRVHKLTSKLENMIMKNSDCFRSCYAKQMENDYDIPKVLKTGSAKYSIGSSLMLQSKIDADIEELKAALIYLGKKDLGREVDSNFYESFEAMKSLRSLAKIKVKSVGLSKKQEDELDYSLTNSVKVLNDNLCKMLEKICGLIDLADSSLPCKLRLDDSQQIAKSLKVLKQFFQNDKTVDPEKVLSKHRNWIRTMSSPSIVKYYCFVRKSLPLLKVVGDILKFVSLCYELHEQTKKDMKNLHTYICNNLDLLKQFLKHDYQLHMDETDMNRNFSSFIGFLQRVYHIIGSLTIQCESRQLARVTSELERCEFRDSCLLEMELRRSIDLVKSTIGKHSSLFNITLEYHDSIQLYESTKNQLGFSYEKPVLMNSTSMPSFLLSRTLVSELLYQKRQNTLMFVLFKQQLKSLVKFAKCIPIVSSIVSMVCFMRKCPEKELVNAADQALRYLTSRSESLSFNDATRLTNVFKSFALDERTLFDYVSRCLSDPKDKTRDLLTRKFVEIIYLIATSNFDPQEIINSQNLDFEFPQLMNNIVRANFSFCKMPVRQFIKDFLKFVISDWCVHGQIYETFWDESGSHTSFSTIMPKL